LKLDQNFAILEATGDFVFDSHRVNRTLSRRPRACDFAVRKNLGANRCCKV
jgi:hypothetical protein